MIRQNSSHQDFRLCIFTSRSHDHSMSDHMILLNITMLSRDTAIGLLAAVLGSVRRPPRN